MLCGQYWYSYMNVLRVVLCGQYWCFQASYPLRPELAESTYFLYMATRNPVYLKV